MRDRQTMEEMLVGPSALYAVIITQSCGPKSLFGKLVFARGKNQNPPGFETDSYRLGKAVAKM